jgi:hypothetical protein
VSFAVCLCETLRLLGALCGFMFLTAKELTAKSKLHDYTSHSAKLSLDDP